jgi:hypothetical protein
MKKSMKVEEKKDFHFEKIYNFRDIGGVQTECSLWYIVPF